ncbi:CPBP family intramembrane glutamic endopeptidase [Companilactobacillus sp. HBUAS59699]|uniref:CPBP family intramembrane glutamic endopeptidase n=1 Tax=Companilactobacillus sp. HBUAS59699 TaxID=3109358 RepID=UPI002FF0CECB
MKIIKSLPLKIFAVWLIFPVMLYAAVWVIPTRLSSNIKQGLADLLVFLAAYFLNYLWFHQKIHWFNSDRLFDQFSTALPTIIFVAYSSFAMFFVRDMTFQFEIVLMTILVGLAEEFCFRGLLIPLFLKQFRGNAYKAVIGSSILFGLMHLINLKSISFGYVSIQVIFAISFGLLLGAIYVKTNNLLLVVALHMLKDVFPLLSPSTLREAAKMQFSMLSLIVCIVWLILTIVIARKQTKGLMIESY